MSPEKKLEKYIPMQAIAELGKAATDGRTTMTIVLSNDVIERPKNNQADFLDIDGPTGPFILLIPEDIIYAVYGEN